MTTELKQTSSAICEAHNDLFEIDKTAKSLYTLLDEFLVREEGGQLSADVVEDAIAILKEELLNAAKGISRAREIIVRSMSACEVPSIRTPKPAKESS